jgi:hypothetical protein
MPPETQNTTQTVEQMGALTTAFSNFTGIGDSLKELTDGLFQNFEKLGSLLNDTTVQSNSASLAVSTLISSFAGAGITFQDAGKDISLFSDQINETIQAAKTLASPITALKGIASSLGLNLGVIDFSNFDKAAAKIKELSANLFASMDAHMKTQDKMIQLAAQSGDLSRLFSEAGTNMQNINELTLKSNQELDKTMQATNMTTISAAEKVKEYYSELGKIPGALKQTIDAATGTVGKVSELTAVIQLARGSGRDTKDIILDLSSAFNTLGLSGESALKFTARMGELSSKFEMDLPSVRQVLTDTAGSFKLIGTENQKMSNIMEGATRIINNYMQAFKDTGISGDTAIAVIKSMTEHVSKLDMAQRSFLSSQSGGPGGLRGAFDIEKKMKEGKVDEVFEDVRKTLMSQFGGKIISVDEASKSEAAAQQLVRQRLMIQQGPLGQFAKSEAEAGRILEAFSEVSSGKRAVTGLADSIVQDTMKKGVQLQDQTATKLGEILSLIREWKNLSQTRVTGAMQAATTAGVGTQQWQNVRSEAAERNRQDLSQTRAAAARTTGQYAETRHKLTSREEFGMSENQIVKETVALIKSMPQSFGAMKDMFTKAGGFLGERKTEEAKEAVSQIKERIDRRKEEAERESNPVQQIKLQREIKQEEAAVISAERAIEKQERENRTREFRRAADIESSKPSEPRELSVVPASVISPAIPSTSVLPRSSTLPTSPTLSTSSVSTDIPTGSPIPVKSPLSAETIPLTRSEAPINDTYKQVIEEFKTLKGELKDKSPVKKMIEELQKALYSGDQSEINKAEVNIGKDIINKESKIKSITDSDKRAETQKEILIAKESLELSKAAQKPLEQPKEKREQETESIVGFGADKFFTPLAERKLSTERVESKQDIREAATRTATNVAAATTASTTGTTAVTSPPPINVTCRLEVPECPHCRRQLPISDHSIVGSALQSEEKRPA